MKRLQLLVLALFVSAFVLTAASAPTAVKSQGHVGPVGGGIAPHCCVGGDGPTEAPAGFFNETNGFEVQGDPNTPGTFLGDKAVFEKRDTVETGLGPVYNAQSCTE